MKSETTWKWKRAVFLGAGVLGASLVVAADSPTLRIGWAQVDITPAEPVYLAGQFNVRVSQGVMDPVTTTVLALESTRGDPPASLILVSCDLINVQDTLRDAVRALLRQRLPDLDPKTLIMFATHTHAAPLTTTHDRYSPEASPRENPYGLDLGVLRPADYVEFAVDRIATAVVGAWEARVPGSIAYGLGHAVVGRNRLTAYVNGRSRMYGALNDAEFSHIEGMEDSSLHVLATYDPEERLTGLVLNLPCPSQVSESAMMISADFWHETRVELRRRFGPELFVLAQNAPAGDQSPHLHGNESRTPKQIASKENREARMWRLAGRTQREEIGVRIANAVEGILPLIEKEREIDPVLAHHVALVELPRRLIPERDVDAAREEAAKHRVAYETALKDLEANSDLLRDRRWVRDTSVAYRLMKRNESVVARFGIQKTQPVLPVEVHVARLGDIAFASNPFELYLDFGFQIQARSRAVQIFLIQLAGPGSYAPTERSVAGGAYGAVPASTEIGPEGARSLVDWTIRAVNAFWEGEG